MTFFGFLSPISSMNRFGTICQERPNCLDPSALGRMAPAATSLSQYRSTSFWSSQLTNSEKPSEKLKCGPPLKPMNV